MTLNLSRPRMVKLSPAHDEALKRIARRRGTTVSALLREAVIAHFSLPTDPADDGHSTRESSK